MSREKQIDEIAKLICTYPQCTYYNIIGGCEARECSIADNAEKIYNAGYRKQSEGEWIVTDADSGSFGEYEPFIEFKCPKCESDYGIESGQYDWQYGEPIPWVACPLCGAKMKGGE